MTPGIVVRDLCKSFNLSSQQSSTTIMEAVMFGRRRRFQKKEQFWALQDISFTVEYGQMLGVIGRNGAGKSTLLQLVSGIGSPDRGEIQINGSLGALLDLGAGFHPDLTGRENVFVLGAIAGLKRYQIQQKFAQIVEFAELETFIDTPLRTYSTGMKMRLAFSVAIHTDPQILLVDEFLSVGDVSFQEKCLERIKLLKEAGCAMMLVSHNLSQVQKLCNNAIWLAQGNIKAYGSAKEVVTQYFQASKLDRPQMAKPLSPQIINGDRRVTSKDAKRFGSGELEIKEVSIKPSSIIQSGNFVEISITYYSEQENLLPAFIVSISRKENHQICFDTHTGKFRFLSKKIKHKGTIKLQLERLDLAGGEYFVNVGAYDEQWEKAYDYHWHMHPLVVDARSSKRGVLNPPLNWEFSNDI